MERFYWLFFSIEMVIGFSTFTLLMWWCQWIVSPMLKQPCFPKIKPSRSWYRVIIYFYAWLIPFGEILFRFSFPFLLLGFAIKIILAFILQENLHKELIVPCTYQWCQMGMKVSLYNFCLLIPISDYKNFQIFYFFQSHGGKLCS